MAAASLAAAAYPERGRRRPAWALLHWVNTLVRRQRQAHDLHLVFTDGLTLCTVLERLHPATELVRFRRAATRGPALSNIEQALALVWRFSPQASAMPSADQVLDGSPRDLLLRFISELYTLFVVRPARARMRVALPWLQQFLTPYGLEVSQATYAPPHKGLGADFRSGTALACALHALLPPARTAGLDGAIFGCPRNESERAKTIRAVFAILEAERLAPCSAREFLLSSQRSPEPMVPGARGDVAANGPGFEAEILLICISAMHQRFGEGTVRLPRRVHPPFLHFRDETRPRKLVSLPPPAVSVREETKSFGIELHSPGLASTAGLAEPSGTSRGGEDACSGTPSLPAESMNAEVECQVGRGSYDILPEEEMLTADIDGSVFESESSKGSETTKHEQGWNPRYPGTYPGTSSGSRRGSSHTDEKERLLAEVDAFLFGSKIFDTSTPQLSKASISPRIPPSPTDLPRPRLLPSRANRRPSPQAIPARGESPGVNQQTHVSLSTASQEQLSDTLTKFESNMSSPASQATAPRYSALQGGDAAQSSKLTNSLCVGADEGFQSVAACNLNVIETHLSVPESASSETVLHQNEAPTPIIGNENECDVGPMAREPAISESELLVFDNLGTVESPERIKTPATRNCSHLVYAGTVPVAAAVEPFAYSSAPEAKSNPCVSAEQGLFRCDDLNHAGSCPFELFSSVSESFAAQNANSAEELSVGGSFDAVSWSITTPAAAANDRSSRMETEKASAAREGNAPTLFCGDGNSSATPGGSIGLPTTDAGGVSCSGPGDGYFFAGLANAWINDTDLPGAGGVEVASAVAQRSGADRCDEGWSVAAPSSATCAASFPQGMEGAAPDTKESMSLPSTQLLVDDASGSAWSNPTPGSASCTAAFGHEGAGALIAAEGGDAPSAAGEQLRRGDGGDFTALFEEGATVPPTSDVGGVSSVGDGFDMAGSSTPWINETDLPGAGGAVAQRSGADRCDEGWSVAAPSSATCAASFPQDMEGGAPDTKESMSLPSMQLLVDDASGSAWSNPTPGSASCTAAFGHEGAGALIAAEGGDAPSAAGEQLRRGDGGDFTALFEEGATVPPTSDVGGVSSVGDGFDMAGSSTPWINETDLPGAGGAVAQRSGADRCDEGWSVAAPSSATCAASFPQDMEGGAPDTKESMSLPSMQLLVDDASGSAWSNPTPGSASCTAAFGHEGAGALIAAEGGDAPSAAGEELRRGDGGDFTALFEEGATVPPTSDVGGVSSVGDGFDMAGSSTPWINETDLPGAGGAVAQRSGADRCDEGWSVAAPSSATCAASFPQGMEGAAPDTKESMSLPSMQLLVDDASGSAWSNPTPGSASCTAAFGHEGAGALIAAEGGDAPSAAGEELRRGDGGDFTALFEEGATVPPTSDVGGVSSVGDGFDMAGSSTPWIHETDLPGAGGAVAQRSDADRCDEGWSVAAPSSATCAASFPQDMEGGAPDTKESMSLPSMQLLVDDTSGSAWSNPTPGSASCTAAFGHEGAGALIAAEGGDAPSAAGEQLRRGDGGDFTALFEEGATVPPTSDVGGVSSVGDGFDMAGSSTPWINETDLPGAGGAVAQRSDADRCDEGWSVAAPSSATCAASFPQDMEGGAPDTKESMSLPSMQLLVDDASGSAWSNPTPGSASCTAAFGHEGAGALIAAEGGDAPSAAGEELWANFSEGTAKGAGDLISPAADVDDANTALPLTAVDSASGAPILSTPERRDACRNAQNFRALDSTSFAVVPSATASVGQMSAEHITDDRNATRLSRSSSRKFGPPTPSRRASDAQITSDELARSLTLVSTPCDALVQEDMYSPAIEVLIWLCCAYSGEGVAMPSLEPAVRWCDRKDRSNTKTLTVGRINGIVRDRASLRFLLQGPEGNPIVEPAHSMLQVHLYSEEKAQVFRDSLLHAQMHPKACLEQLLKQS